MIPPNRKKKNLKSNNNGDNSMELRHKTVDGLHSVVSKDYLPTITTKSSVHRNAAGSLADDTFPPFNRNHYIAQKSNTISDISIPVPLQPSFQFPKSKRKCTIVRKLSIVCILFALLLISSYTIYIYLYEVDDSEEENRTESEPSLSQGVPVELLEACQGVEKDGNIFRIQQSLIIESNIIEISNVSLSCFPRDALADFAAENLDFSFVIFTSVNITVIDENVFDFGLGLDNLDIQFFNSNVQYFLNQTHRVNTTFSHLPKNFTALSVGFQDTRHFSITDNLVDFMFGNPRTIVGFVGMIDNLQLVELRDALLEKPVVFQDQGFPIFAFVLDSTEITTIPKDLFSPKTMNIKVDAFWLILTENINLEFLEPNSFQKTNNVVYDVSINSSPKLSNLTEVGNLNLRTLDIVETGVLDLTSIDFSTMTDFDSLDVGETPIEPLCTEIEAFRESLGLADSVKIESCIEYNKC
eukprot:snap_masked-scaffold_40-processed-gene-2.19-mRNA-1 protein AED:1.00 eAED:1.00 QI:0/0/0/0/1/1/3/0/467